ncbi:alpha-2-macroglobulin family protein [Pedobacter jamesrossensis]|uniref:Alpha-2-macroglobulin family protein n=1 Tax=Pedobacter jamesrossensis TaxID=1908238 RepID=A0ABV8NQW4_9SPHI
MKNALLKTLLILFFFGYTFNSNAQQNQYFLKEFKRVDSLASKAEPKAALSLINMLNNKARLQNNSEMLVKSVVYRMLFQSYLEENQFVKIIKDLQQDVSLAKQPAKSILQSLLAESYWKYYQKNRYQFAQRTKVLGYKSTDISTWSLPKITEETIKNYIASLAETNLLQNIESGKMKDILIGDSSTRYLRPTLYDILAHRAIDVFVNTQIEIANNDNSIDFSKNELFLDFKNFHKLNFSSLDSTSFTVQAFKVFQTLNKCHNDNGNNAALADVELKRLKFIYQRTGSDKHEIFFNALENLAVFSESTEIYADVLCEQVMLIQRQSLTNFKPENNLIKAVELAERAIKAYPKSIGAANAKNLIDQIKTKNLKIEIKGYNLPDSPFQIKFSHKNTDTAFLKLYKLRAVDADFNFDNVKQYDKFLNQQKPIKEWQVSLPKKVDYIEHNFIDKVEALPIGNYVLFAGNSRDKSFNDLISYANFKITKLAITSRVSGLVNHQYFIADSKTGEPLQNVTINERSREYAGGKYSIVDRGKITSDKNGFAEGGSFLSVNNVVFNYGKDSVNININGSNFNYREESKKVILFADRPIYRPGQIVYFKGIYLQNEDYKSSILAKENIDVVFKDVNWADIQKLSLTTNDYGTFQGSFTIPQGRLNGRMQINTRYGSISIQVEEYKRPTFEIVFDKFNNMYKLNDSVLVKGKAVTFSGYPVGGAKLKYTISRISLPDMTSRYEGNLVKQIVVGKADLKADGNFSFNFLAMAGNDSKKNYMYKITVDVTDVNGETRTSGTEIKVGEKDIRLTFNLPDKIFLTSKQDSFSFDVLNLNNQPINAKVETEWLKLQEPQILTIKNPFSVKPEAYSLNRIDFKYNFPNAEYNDESNPANWPLSKISFNKNIEIENGFGELPLNDKSLPAGYYKVKITAINSVNDSVSTDKIVKVFNQKPEVITTISDWLIAENSIIPKAGTAIFRIAGALNNANAYYEVYYKDKIIDKVWLKVSPKQSIVKIKAQPDFEDSFNVQFSMVHNGVIYQSMQSVLIKDTSKELDVKFLSFRDKLQPGEKESWKLRITNKNGEKQMAEMVATLYDASLDNLSAMNWNSISKQQYSYHAYNWQSEFNSLRTGQELWFLRNYYRFYQQQNRNYENFNLLGYSYYGGYNDGYHNYLRKIELAKKKDLLDAFAKKLEQLDKGKGFYGVINDVNGFAVPGALVKNGKIAAYTDQFGIYQISAKVGDKLSIVCIGFLPVSLTLNYLGRNDVIMKEDSRELNEVVVTGYGAQLKSAVAGSSVMLRDEVETNKIVLKEINTKTGEKFNKSDLIRTVRALDEVAITVDDSKTYDFVSIEKAYDPKTGFAIVNGKPVFGTKEVATRTYFNETAFFYPQLQTNEAGEINIDFTIPQSLTRFKMMGFAHTKDLKTGTITKALITQKQLAISANAPRFFREGDTIQFSARLNNLSGKNLSGEAILEIRDALTNKLISIFDKPNVAVQQFELGSGGNKALNWVLVIPSGLNAISYKLLAQSEKFSDGEEMTIPVLPNSMLVTEIMPLNVRGETSKTFVLDKLFTSGKSQTLKNKSLTFEFTSNPVWYAVQALPYLMEYPFECTEQTFSRFYSNSFATGIINSSPKIKQVFESWKQVNNGEALLSNLEKNANLKSILLEETPWVRDAENDAERKKRLAVLFDLNRMTYELKSNLEKLESMQNANGSFPWFSGMAEDRYITQHIVLGMGQLKQSKLVDEKAFPNFNKVLNKAISYLDEQLQNDYKKETQDKKIAYLPLHYLYARSYSPIKNEEPNFNKALAFYLKKINENWLTMEPYQQGQAALILIRNGNKVEAQKVINLLKQRAQQSEELGMYWTNNRYGLWWYENPVETQSLLIEAFDEIAADSKSVEEMKIWLLKNKQTNDWKTTKATVAACYALLKRGYNLLDETAEPEILIGGKTYKDFSENAKETGTGYEKITVTAENIKPEMAKISVKNTNKTVAWGALYWQYFEQLDKITPAETGVKINKQLFLQTASAKENVLTKIDSKSPLKLGDKIKVRIEIRSDRDMEYIHLKDMRSAGFEPANVISKYKYQDGLSYYESTKDASTNFFISDLRKGTYVFEYELRVTHAGNFSNGITTLQSMYAPEFTTHSEGVRVTVKPQP